MRLPMKSVHSIVMLISVVALQACAPPEGMPDQAADAALNAQEEAEARMVLVPPPGVKFMECVTGGSVDTDWIPVGAEGDDITLGEHRLFIPAGALGNQTVSFRLIDPGNKRGQVLVFTRPAKFTVAEPIQLTISYSDCTPPVGTDSLKMLRYDYPEPKPTDVDDWTDPISETVTAYLNEFSAYIIGAM